MNPYEHGNPFLSVGATLFPAVKRVVFVSYHHDGDQPYYDYFSRVFSGAYQIIRDNSLRQEVWSDDADYIMRRIREDYLTGTSCTVVLCGKATPQRKFVDWEIKATLDKEHGLVGICLPTNPECFVPPRFLDSYRSGFAVWTTWKQLFSNQQANAAALRQAVEDANVRPKSAIRNSRVLMSRNGVSL